ncbi:hypothetical protein PHSC3_001537 [Chlamydiales bacterium STE3]|nr:hypothetical protein PHSC3_001537 [Chlamydiales bacterium STE3]
MRIALLWLSLFNTFLWCDDAQPKGPEMPLGPYVPSGPKTPVGPTTIEEPFGLQSSYPRLELETSNKQIIRR